MTPPSSDEPPHYKLPVGKKRRSSPERRDVFKRPYLGPPFGSMKPPPSAVVVRPPPRFGVVVRVPLAANREESGLLAWNSEVSQPQVTFSTLGVGAAFGASADGRA